MILPWLASWGALLLSCVALAVAVWLGIDRVRLRREVDGLRACRLPVPLDSTFLPYVGRCERRDEHAPEQCAPGKEWPK